MKYIKAALLLLAVAWSYDTSAQDVKLEVVDAKTIIKGKGERTYRSFLLKVLIHNESPDRAQPHDGLGVPRPSK